jgi:hypothetical protein
MLNVALTSMHVALAGGALALYLIEPSWLRASLIVINVSLVILRIYVGLGW